VVLYGCETWSLILKEEHKLNVFENSVLRRIFGPKRSGVRGGWGKLHNEELHDLYSSPSTIRIIKSRRMRWAGHVARMGENEERVERISRNTRRKDPLIRQRRKWIDNIKMDLLETELGGVNWIAVAQDWYSWRALVNGAMNFWVP
jgi:hypothetical protein